MAFFFSLFSFKSCYGRRFFKLQNIFIMDLLWYLNPSLGADYGRFTCDECGRVFHYSPRLACHCNSCAIKELEHMARAEKDPMMRWEYNRAQEQLREL
jgi:hypothetical protein